MTDNWPEETGWAIQDSNGGVVAGVDVGTYSNQPNTLQIADVALDLNECYTFTMIDTYGDGLYASQWGNYADGYAEIASWMEKLSFLLILITKVHQVLSSLSL